jgi:hypothetical protein
MNFEAMNFKNILNWQLQPLDAGCVYSAVCVDQTEVTVRQAVGETIEKAVAQLAENINDQSLYLLFEWNKSTAVLTVVVTDEVKLHDAGVVVRCEFSGMELWLKNSAADSAVLDEYAESMQYWIKDYLTTCGSFFHYSLIAIFHSDTRSKTQLL